MVSPGTATNIPGLLDEDDRTDNGEAVTGTHPVIVGPRHVVVRDVELYAEMDDGGPVGSPVDVEILNSIAAETNAMMARGRYPGVVVGHEEELRSKGEPVIPGLIGRIVGQLRVAQSDKTGLLTIYGDLELPRHSFEAFVRSGTHPSRSSELLRVDSEKPWFLKQVALLGRETPGADIPDIHLNSVESSRAYGTAQSVLEVNSKETGMDMKEVRKALSEMDEKERNKLFASYKPDDKADNAEDEDEDDKAENSENEKKDDEKKSDNSAKPEAATFSIESHPEFVAMRTRLGAMEQENRRAKYEIALNSLKTDKGIELDVAEEAETLVALNSQQADKHLERIEKNYRRSMNGNTAINASKSATQVANSAAGVQRAATDLTTSDANRITTLASKLMKSENSLSPDEAYHKAAKELNLEKAVGL